jgi:xanthine dehydrogenase YagT iron-sulfur-binding subunit
MGLSHVSRRGILTAGSAAAALSPFIGFVEARADAPPKKSSNENTDIDVDLTVNGQDRHLIIDPRITLLDALRERMGLTGAKKGCDHGQCGACTVHVDGRRVLSCLTLAAAVRGPVTTIEGLASPGGALHPMQQAFIDHDAFQCGYCTPGQIMSAITCVKEGHAGSPDDIREFMSGNLCRCAAYPHIVAAIQQAKPQMERPDAAVPICSKPRRGCGCRQLWRRKSDVPCGRHDASGFDET